MIPVLDAEPSRSAPKTLKRGILDKTGIDPIWGQALQYISQQVNEGTFRIWFEPTVGLGLADGVYSIGVASEFAKDWIATRFQSTIDDAVSHVMGVAIRCEIVVSPELSQVLFREDTARGAVSSTTPAVNVALDPVDQGPDASRGSLPLREANPLETGTGLLEKYVFDTFVIGQSNRLPMRLLWPQRKRRAHSTIPSSSTGASV